MVATTAARAAISKQTFAQFGRERLSALCQAAGGPSVSGHVCDLFTRMLQPWGERQIGEIPQYRSNVADDEAPFEFSIAFSNGAPEVQFYVEALGNPANLRSNMAAGRALLKATAAEVDASLYRLSLLEDLFFPTEPQGAFTIWTGVSCTPGCRPQLKVYLNPQVQGARMARSIVADAMRRLGFGTQWSRLSDALHASGDRFDEVAIVSLDLSSASRARVKVYVRHHGATIANINTFASEAEEYYPDDAAVFYGSLADCQGPFLRKPPLSELVFTDPNRHGPSSVTLEFPIGSYVETDEVARQRIARCLTAFDLSPEGYLASVQAFATRPLSERAGLHAHVTLRRLANQPRIGIYFASEAYVPTAPTS